MSADLFAACWARWDRADEHRQAMPHIWNEYLDDHPFDFALNYRGHGEFVLTVRQSEPVPSRFAVLCGEWLYNLRSCLDYTIWATAAYDSGQVPPPGGGNLQYPIYDSVHHWERNLYRLKALDDRHRRMLRHMQPFAGDLDANFLARLNELARLDRHRRLNTATAYVAVLEPVVQLPVMKNPDIRLQWGQRVLKNGRADVARFIVEPWDDNIDPSAVKVNPRIGIDPEIEQWSYSPFWRSTRFSERLSMIQVFVAAEIATYEYDCTGSSHKQNLLSKDFRAECDARDRSEPRDVYRGDVNWSDPVRPRTSTKERFEGRDFYPDSRLITRDDPFKEENSS